MERRKSWDPKAPASAEIDDKEMLERIDKVWPNWWPLHDGSPVKHVYLQFDEVMGKELIIPRVGKAISHKVKMNRPVDFQDEQVKIAVMEHVAESIQQTPFLSTSYTCAARAAHGEMASSTNTHLPTSGTIKCSGTTFRTPPKANC